MKRFAGLICTFLLFFTICLFAEMNNTVKAENENNENYQPLNLNKEANKYRNNPDFDYLEASSKKQDDSKKAPQQMDGTTIFDVMRFIYWTIIIVGVLLLLTKVFKINIFKLFSATPLPTAKVLHPEDLTDNIHEISFDALIEEAVRTQNYRRAVRLYYLQTLKKMSDRHVIEWKNEKTNRQYLQEIKDPEMKQLFTQLTLLFEYIWYGEYPADVRHLDQTQKIQRQMVGR